MTTSRLNPMLVARTVLLDGSVSGLRSIDLLGIDSSGHRCPIFRAGPREGREFFALHRLCYRYGPFLRRYGGPNRNIGDRVKKLLQAATQVYIIDGNDPRFAKYEAAY